jgi:hypothetical protein
MMEFMPTNLNGAPDHHRRMSTTTYHSANIKKPARLHIQVLA